jgi:hypothetical protein
MIFRTSALFVAWSLSASSPYCLAQEQDGFADSALSGERWQQRVQDARRRSEEFVAKARARRADAPPVDDREEAREADRRVMSDPSLRPGDIIATSKGFLVFVGRNGEDHLLRDFVPIAGSPKQP